MSLRFRRSIRLAPGLRLNVRLRGPSLSIGPRSIGQTIGPAGLTSHVGIPGTGLSIRETKTLSSLAGGQRSRGSTGGDASPASLDDIDARLSLGEDGRLRL